MSHLEKIVLLLVLVSCGDESAQTPSRQTSTATAPAQTPAKTNSEDLTASNAPSSLDPDEEAVAEPEDPEGPDVLEKDPMDPIPSMSPSPAANNNGAIVEFHIAAGTGAGAWNTAMTKVTLKVGQTLRLVNDDTVTHRLHTNGAPCPHGVAFAAGKSFDCKLTKAIDGTKPDQTYDHIAGKKASFFLVVAP